MKDSDIIEESIKGKLDPLYLHSLFIQPDLHMISGTEIKADVEKITAGDVRDKNVWTRKRNLSDKRVQLGQRTTPSTIV